MVGGFQTDSASTFMSQKILAKVWGGGTVHNVKFILSSSLITTQTLVNVCHSVWALCSRSKKLGSTMAPPLLTGVISDCLETRLSSMLLTTLYTHFSQTVSMQLLCYYVYLVCIGYL